LLLFAVDHEHCGIHIEDDARRWLGNQGDPLKEAVMQSAQLRQRSGGNPEQEAPQRRCVGITWQASEVLKDAVLSEQLSRFDSLQPEDHRVEQGQNHLADTVAIVSLSESNIRGERVLEPDPRQEAMQHIDACVVRQRTRTKRNCKPTWTFGHHGEPYLKGSFHRKHLGIVLNLRQQCSRSGHVSRTTPDSGSNFYPWAKRLWGSPLLFGV